MQADCNNCKRHEQGKHPAEVVLCDFKEHGKVTCQDCLEHNLYMHSPKDVTYSRGSAHPLVFHPKKQDVGFPKNWPVKFTPTPEAPRPGILSSAPGGAARANVGKIPVNLVDRELVLAAARALGAGRDKYTKLLGTDATHNWRAGLSWSETLGSLERHLQDFKAGKDIDPETGLCQLDLMAANLQFLCWYYVNRKQFDDRYKEPK